jgi:hypothetical protein
MRKILFIFFLFIAFYSKAQYNIIGQKTQFFNGLAIPRKDTSAFKGVNDTNVVFFGTDSNFYYRIKGNVKQVASPLANYPTTYALSNDIKDSIQRRWDSARVKTYVTGYNYKLNTDSINNIGYSSVYSKNKSRDSVVALLSGYAKLSYNNTFTGYQTITGGNGSGYGLILKKVNPSILLQGDNSSYYPAISFSAAYDTTRVTGAVQGYNGVSLFSNIDNIANSNSPINFYYGTTPVLGQQFNKRYVLLNNDSIYKGGWYIDHNLPSGKLRFSWKQTGSTYVTIDTIGKFTVTDSIKTGKAIVFPDNSYQTTAATNYLTYSASSGTTNSATYTLSNTTSALYTGGEVGGFITVSTSSFNVNGAYKFIKLVTGAAGLNINSTAAGQHYYIMNTTGSGITLAFTLKDLSGSTVTTIGANSSIHVVYDGTNYLKL